MNVIIIAGFLGSGKTTLILQLAKSLSSAFKKTVIIENELGEFGVDGDYLEREGLQVRQLYGGCMCCTLSLGLAETLENLHRYYHPDTVIMEASGAADPGDIVVNLGLCRSGIQSAKVITLVDVKRFQMLITMMTPLLESQIRAGDIVIINKTDLVEAEVVESVMRNICEINSRGRVYAISLEKRDDVSFVKDMIEC